MSYLPAIGTAYGTFFSILTVKLNEKSFMKHVRLIIDS